MERLPNHQEQLNYWQERRQIAIEALEMIDRHIAQLGRVASQETLFDDEEDWIYRGNE